MIFSVTNLNIVSNSEEFKEQEEKEFIKMLELILCCKQYVDKKLYKSFLQVNNIEKILSKLSHLLAKKPSFYSCLLGILEIYEDIYSENKK